jgi:hypothetical protein
MAGCDGGIGPAVPTGALTVVGCGPGFPVGVVEPTGEPPDVKCVAPTTGGVEVVVVDSPVDGTGTCST